MFTTKSYLTDSFVLRYQHNFFCGVREGDTYLPSVGMSLIEDSSLEEIPPPKAAPIFQPLETTSTVDMNESTEIYFDLEATGLGNFTYAIISVS